MKIAICQTNIEWENKEINILRAIDKMEEARRNDAELILFPEMSFTGFSMNTSVTAEKDLDTIEVMKKKAFQVGIAVGFGWVKSCGNKAENHYSVISNKGELLSDYVKIHPFSYAGEDNYFKGGSEISFFALEGVRFATLICYDLRFPEVFQIASSNSDVIIVPANWPQKREEHWITLLKARAIENQTGVIGINCVGSIGGLEYSGNSIAINSNGEVIELARLQEQILFVNTETLIIQSEMKIKNDRNPRLYIDLYKKFLLDN